MAKTVKYEMYINTPEMSGNLIPISKKVFDATIENYKKQVEESNRYDLERFRDENPDGNEEYIDYTVDMMVKTTEYEKYTETLYAFHDNGTALCLRKSECKDGYHWK